MTVKTIACRSLHKQRGVASLFISLIVLITITFVTFYTSRAVVMETKIATNDFRGRMAFEAAEAGIEEVMNAMNQGLLLTDDNDNNNLPDLVPGLLLFDTDNDGTTDSNTLTLTNGSTVTLELTQPSNTGTVVLIDVKATGKSDDATAERVINQTIVAIPPLPNLPDSPMLSRGALAIGGSAKVSNLEGHSTIWTGGNLDLGGDMSTATEIADPAGANYPDCLGGSVQCDPVASSNREIVGVDIIESDTSLANLTDEQFFQNFFGTTMEVYKKSRADIVTTNLVSQVNPKALGKVIWVDGNVALSGVNDFGTAAEPVIIIVDGSFSATGTQNIFGLLYVIGAFNGGGTVKVTGAAIAANNANVNTTGGTLDVRYNSKLLEATYKSAKPAGGSGSWRDFDFN